MKIFIISNLFPPHYLGGYELLCKNVCDELAARGHELFVLTSDHKSSEESKAEQGIYPVERLLKLYAPFGQPAGMNYLARYRTTKTNYSSAMSSLSKFSPDVVFVWSQLRLTLGAAYAAKDLGLEPIFTFNDDHICSYRARTTNWSAKQMAKYFAVNLLAPKLTVGGLNLNRSTSISKSIKEDIEEQGVAIAKTRIIYQGIPLSDFPLKKEPGLLSKETTKLLYAGQLHEYKGVHTVIEAVAKLVKVGRKVELTIAGSGNQGYEQRLESLVRELQLSETVNFIGRVKREQMHSLYTDHHIFVFPSIWREPFGLTHLEAMACGTTVVSTTNGGPGEFIEDMKNSLEFKSEDSGSLASKIELLLDDEGLSMKLASSARNMVTERFSMKRYVDDIETFLKDLSFTFERKAS